MIRPAVVLLIFFTLITGVAYPLGLSVFGARTLEPGAVGVEQSRADQFWSRPSTATPTASAGSNLALSNPAFIELTRQRRERLQAAHPTHHETVPEDLITMSGSGLDPHLTVAAARYQVDRVAQARQRTPDELYALIESFTEPRFLGIFGEPRVNVVRLNLALEK